jgi:hypothetical protein
LLIQEPSTGMSSPERRRSSRRFSRMWNKA